MSPSTIVLRDATSVDYRPPIANTMGVIEVAAFMASVETGRGGIDDRDFAATRQAG